MNRNDPKKIFDEILGSYDQCNDNAKFAIRSLTISTKKISNSDGRLSGTIGSDPSDESFNLRKFNEKNY